MPPELEDGEGTPEGRRGREGGGSCVTLHLVKHHTPVKQVSLFPSYHPEGGG